MDNDLNSFHVNTDPKTTPLPSIPTLENALSAMDRMDLRALKEMLQKGLDPNSETTHGTTILGYAIENYNYEAVKIALEAGADPNRSEHCTSIFSFQNQLNEYADVTFEIKYLSPLMKLLNQPMHPETLPIAKSLLLYGANPNSQEPQYALRPMHFAANQCSKDILCLLLEHGAHVDPIAFKSQRISHSLYSNHVITPLFLAIHPKQKIETSDCIFALLQKGANIHIHSNTPRPFALILAACAEKDFKFATSLLVKQLERDFDQMDEHTISKTLTNFLNEPYKTEKVYNTYVDHLLRSGASFHSTFHDMKYFSHLNSWKGTFASKDSYNVGKTTEDTYTVQESEGWSPENFFVRKIKHLLMLYEGVDKNQIHCEHKFSEPRESVGEKLRTEITQQIHHFFTYSHIKMVQYSPNSVENIQDLIQNKKIPSVTNNITSYLELYILDQWRHKLQQLRPGKTFSFCHSTLDHVTYMDFKKQTDGSFSHILYNLGTGMHKHAHHLSGRVYPHIIQDISNEHFQNLDQKGMFYLYILMHNPQFPSTKENVNALHPYFSLIYFAPGAMNGNYPDAQTLKKYIPMRIQSVGNCVVKNNLFGMRNRLQNDKLYYFIKNFEITHMRSRLNIQNTFLQVREFQKDLDTLNYILTSKADSTKMAEKELFRFFQKRAKPIPEELAKKPGTRLAYSLSNQQNSTICTRYFYSCPQLITFLHKIGTQTKSKELLLKSFQFEKKITISSKKNHHFNTLLKNQIRNFNLIPCVGQNVMTLASATKPLARKCPDTMDETDFSTSKYAKYDRSL